LQDQPASGADFIVDRQNDRVEFKLGDDREPFRSPGYLAALRRDRAYSDAEARRMLYVAATRARDWLILPSVPADSLSRHDSFHTFLDDAAPHWLTPDSDPDALVIAPRAFDAVSAQPSVLRTPPIEDLHAAWQERHRESIDGGRRDINTQTPSSLGHQQLGESADIGVDESERDASSINPLDLGKAVHEALEAADFTNLDLTLKRTVRICRKHHVDPESVTEHVEQALNSDLLRRAARSDIVHRELPLESITSDGERTTISEGIADLLFGENGRWILVDYKSDQTIPEERRVHYFRQVQLYASMLRNAGVTVAEAHLLLTSSGESIAVPIDKDSAT
ncbi:MAG: hypothetical protein F4Y95_03240, partial [Chloroflexi bacterium]|nr:hypothetical protein [Chloroflexota bacterium]